MSKNEWKSFGDYSEIYIDSIAHGKFVCRCDTVDLPILLEYCWCIRKKRVNFYVTTGFWKEGKTTLKNMEHIIMGRNWIDHANRDTLDNRRDNLRAATPKQNVLNRGVHKNSKLQKKGVYIQHGKVTMEVSDNYERVFSAVYPPDCVEDAARDYDRITYFIHPDFHTGNYPRSDYPDEDLTSIGMAEVMRDIRYVKERLCKNPDLYICKNRVGVPGRPRNRCNTFVEVKNLRDKYLQDWFSVMEDRLTTETASRDRILSERNKR